MNEENKVIAKLIFDLANKLEAEPEELINIFVQEGLFESQKQINEISKYMDALTIKEE